MNLQKNYSFFTWALLVFFWSQGTLGDPYKGGLNDEQLKMRDSFVHEGYMNRTKDDLCSGKVKIQGVESSSGAEDCYGKAVTVTGSSMGDAMIEAVAKMYGMFFGMAGNLNSKTKEHKDMCAFIPMASEMVAMTTQQIGQQTAMVTPIDPEVNKQLTSLERAKKGHETRKLSATMQVAGWGATAACYAAMLAMHAMEGLDAWQVANHVLKLGAATGLAAFYAMKMKKSGDAAAYVQNIIDELIKRAGKGKCDPINNITCYCAQPETRYDQTYCIPEPFKGRDQRPDTLVSCVNDQMRADPQCQCKATNTCYDTVLAPLETQFAMGGAMTSSPLKPINSMTRGNFDSASVNGPAYQNQLRAAKKLLLEKSPFRKDEFRLSEAQKAQAKELESLDLPPGLAAKFASEALKGKGLQFRGDMASDMSSLDLSQYKADDRQGSGGSGKSNVLYFDSPGGRKFGSTSDGPNMDFMNKFQKKAVGDGGEKVLSFAERAAAAAQIDRNPSRNIFDIISSRYRTSTWQRFDVFKEAASAP